MKTKEEIREEFLTETGQKWLNGYNMERYSYWLEEKVLATPPSPAISIEELERALKQGEKHYKNDTDAPVKMYYRYQATAIYTLLANKSASQEAETMKRNPVSFERAKSQVERLNRENLSNPWPLKDVLSKLIEASEILLHKKDYDGHGHEEIFIAVQRAKEIRQQVERLNTGDAVAFGEWLRSLEALEKKHGQWVIESQITTEKLYRAFLSKPTADKEGESK